MTGVGSDRTLRALTGWLGVAVIAELVLLRTGTRTLIHIPGLGRFEASIGVLGELGRFAYYLALVLVASALVYLGWRCWETGRVRGRLFGALAWSFIVVAMLSRMDVLPSPAVAWLALLSTLGLVAVGWRGPRSLPVAFFAGASVGASWSVLGQGAGGGLSGQTVDITIVVAEALLLLAGVSAPLLVVRKRTRAAIVAGLVTLTVVTAGLSVGGSTLAILTLWNLGVPGWFPPIAYGLAFGCIVFTLWTAVTHRLGLTAVAVVLLVAGGVGPISTYQTALVVAAVALVGVTNWSRQEPSGSPILEKATSTAETRALASLP